MSEEQLELMEMPPTTVHQRCKTRYRLWGRCAVIFDEHYKPVREEWCLVWCPLLNERIE